MGIGFHELSFLKFTKKENNFKTLGVIGRQENYIDSNHKIIPKNLKNLADEKYSDSLLSNILGLDNLKSYDVTAKDNPSEILNFNFLINKPEKFDAFFDGGSLQHTFNVPIVMQNISNHVKIGGSIIHVVSSNNLCGFGFYQFSPEFFIRYYSEKNGFKNTNVFVADYDDNEIWYEINSNVLKNISINTSARLICLVKTEKHSEIDVKEIFQEVFFDNNKSVDDQRKNFLFNKKIFVSIYLKILILLDIFSKKINLKKNKNLKTKKILDLIS